MSEPRRRPSTRSSTIKITALAIGAAAAITGGLAAQMASGHDPALGAGSKAGATSAAPSTTTAAPSPTDAPAPSTVVTRAS